MSRRSFALRSLSAVGAASALGGSRARATEVASTSVHLATNAYSWQVFYQREGRDWGAALDSGLAEVKGSGIDGYEPGLTSGGQVKSLVPLLRARGLGMRSVYVNSSLHAQADADRSIREILEVAAEARTAGTRIVVTNPNPIQWGGSQDKDDAQLRFQARSMDRLGAGLREQGQVLAYHNHDIELRRAAREFHHMMAGTDPELVSLCLDSHWVFRGAGDSQVALFDIVRLHGKRVVELHLRQSTRGVWDETLGPGDIDYPLLAKMLQDAGRRPHLVLEVAVEKGTPKTLSTLEAHRRSADYARSVFREVGALQ
jgi:inosose dehydratase